MAQSTISSKGQLVIPREIRRQAGFKTGDVLDIDIEEETGDVRLRKAKSIDELSDYFTSLIKPGTTPLEDTGTIFEKREVRL